MKSWLLVAVVAVMVALAVAGPLKRRNEVIRNHALRQSHERERITAPPPHTYVDVLPLTCPTLPFFILIALSPLPRLFALFSCASRFRRHFPFPFGSFFPLFRFPRLPAVLPPFPHRTLSRLFLSFRF